MYHHLFDLIYACATNQVAAKALVDRILLKIDKDTTASSPPPFEKEA
jgi:hypothetical protein